jgi:hypothetical protein
VGAVKSELVGMILGLGAMISNINAITDKIWPMVEA